MSKRMVPSSLPNGAKHHLAGFEVIHRQQFMVYLRSGKNIAHQRHNKEEHTHVSTHHANVYGHSLSRNLRGQAGAYLFCWHLRPECRGPGNLPASADVSTWR